MLSMDCPWRFSMDYEKTNQYYPIFRDMAGWSINNFFYVKNTIFAIFFIQREIFKQFMTCLCNSLK